MDTTHAQKLHSSQQVPYALSSVPLRRVTLPPGHRVPPSLRPLDGPVPFLRRKHTPGSFTACGGQRALPPSLSLRSNAARSVSDSLGTPLSEGLAKVVRSSADTEVVRMSLHVAGSQRVM